MSATRKGNDCERNIRAGLKSVEEGMMSKQILKRGCFWLGAVVIAITGCRSLPPGHEEMTRNNFNASHAMPLTETIVATETSFDVKTGEIRYTLPQPGYVQIRIGLNKGGALLRNLLDWDFRAAGKHVETWDKKDATGLVYIGDRSDYFLVLNARPEGAKAGFPKSPRLTIEFPESSAKNSDGVPVVSGIVPLRVMIDPEDRLRLAESPFEMAIYVDYVFLMEDEIATNPFNYLIDTAPLPEGEHVVTVNAISYSGLVGAVSVKMWVKK